MLRDIDGREVNFHETTEPRETEGDGGYPGVVRATTTDPQLSYSVCMQRRGSKECRKILERFPRIDVELLNKVEAGSRDPSAAD